MNASLIGKFLLMAGGAFIILWAVFLIAGKIPFTGKPPGDILIKRKNLAVYFPLATSLLLSVVLSTVMMIINSFRK